MTDHEMDELREGDPVTVRPLAVETAWPATFQGWICETQPSAMNPELEESTVRAIVRYDTGEMDEVDAGAVEAEATREAGPVRRMVIECEDGTIYEHHLEDGNRLKITGSGKVWLIGPGANPGTTEPLGSPAVRLYELVEVQG